MVGASHLAADLPCQDAHFVELIPGDGALIAVAADGAGSAANAAEGAQRAVLS